MNENHIIKNALAGASLATIVTIVGYPFDLIKTRMQTGRYLSSLQCLSYTWKKGGFLGFYRGSTMPWISHLTKRPLQYPVAEYMKEKGICNNYLIGAFSGILGTVFGTPLQVIKVSIQTSKKDNNLNVSKVINQNYQLHGWRGFFRGFIPTLIKDTLYSASFVGNYYYLRDWFGTDKPWKTFISGAVAHSITWSIFIPIDNVKTNIQRHQEKKITIQEAIQNTYSRYGFKGFWKGVVPACLRTIPVSGCGVVAYEYVRKILS